APSWMMQALVMACRELPSCMSGIGGRWPGEKNPTPYGIAVDQYGRPAIRAVTRLTNRGDRHKVLMLQQKSRRGL
ncbi:hypothetical protein, partial [Pseudomonas aeruginosa]